MKSSHASTAIVLMVCSHPTSSTRDEPMLISVLVQVFKVVLKVWVLVKTKINISSITAPLRTIFKSKGACITGFISENSVFSCRYRYQRISIRSFVLGIRSMGTSGISNLY